MKKSRILTAMLAVTMLFSLCVFGGSLAYAADADLIIASEPDWADFCASVDGGADYAGQTVALTADIETDQMAGSTLRLGSSVSGKQFAGVFDGGNHTITFTYATEKAGSSMMQPGIGLFSGLKGGTVQNLNVVADITDAHGNYTVGGIAGYMTDGALIDNCHVSGAVAGVKDVGGLAGKAIQSALITNSANRADVTSKSGKTGGIASAMYYPPADPGAMRIENCTNSGTIVTENGSCTAGILGFGTAVDLIGCSNSGSVFGKGTAIGGIAGELRYGCLVDRCENLGDVEKEGNGYGLGGVVGWIRYLKDDAYSAVAPDVAMFTNCTNKGSVTSDGGNVGGIIGTVYNNAVVENCVNYGVVTGGNMSGVILGNYQNTEPTQNDVPDGLTFTGCENYAGTANLSGGNVGILLGHISFPVNDPEKPGFTVENNQSVVVTNEAKPGENLPGGLAGTEVDFVEAGTVGAIRFAQDGNEIAVYLEAAEAGQFVENFVAAELTVEVTGGFGITEFAPASDGIIIDDRGNGTYLIREKEGQGGANDVTGSSILLGTIRLEGFGTGSIGLLAGAPAQLQRRIDDNIVASSALEGGEAITVTIDENTHNLTVEIAFNNQVTAGNTAAYQAMEIVVTGANGEESVYKLGTDEGEGFAAYDEKSASKIIALDENTRYTVEVRGAGYRTAKKSVVLKEDTTVKFWNNVKDEAVDGETKNFLAGEIVADGKINVYDLSAVVSYFGEAELNDGEAHDYARYDLNRDGKVDSKDVAMVLVSWNE